MSCGRRQSFLGAAGGSCFVGLGDWAGSESRQSSSGFSQGWSW